jgi:hypothetical protein
MLENRVLRRIFIPKSEKLTEGRRKWSNEELHTFYFIPIIYSEDKMKWGVVGLGIAVKAITKPVITTKDKYITLCMIIMREKSCPLNL